MDDVGFGFSGMEQSSETNQCAYFRAVSEIWLRSFVIFEIRWRHTAPGNVTGCKQKALVSCALCSDRKPIYVFDTRNIVRCTKCHRSSVHLACWNMNQQQCANCAMVDYNKRAVTKRKVKENEVTKATLLKESIFFSFVHGQKHTFHVKRKLFNIQLVMSISRQQIVADLILSGCFQRYDLSFSDYVHN